MFRKRKLKKLLLTVAIIFGALATFGFVKQYGQNIMHLGEEPVAIYEDVQDYFPTMVIKAADELLIDTVVLADYEAVEGYEIDKIALPVKSLDDHEEDCKFTVYVVEGDKDSGWEKVEEHKLVIKANTYDEDDVNKWVTFNVNIKVEEGQTLAFGSAKDTVVLAYDGGASSVKNFYKNVFETPELVPAALYIDIYGWEIE